MDQSENLTEPAKLLLLVSQAKDLSIWLKLLMNVDVVTFQAALLVKDKIISCNAKAFLKGRIVVQFLCDNSHVNDFVP